MEDPWTISQVRRQDPRSLKSSEPGIFSGRFQNLRCADWPVPSFPPAPLFPQKRSFSQTPSEEVGEDGGKVKNIHGMGYSTGPSFTPRNACRGTPRQTLHRSIAAWTFRRSCQRWWVCGFRESVRQAAGVTGKKTGDILYIVRNSTDSSGRMMEIQRAEGVTQDGAFRLRSAYLPVPLKSL